MLMSEALTCDACGWFDIAYFERQTNPADPDGPPLYPPCEACGGVARKDYNAPPAYAIHTSETGVPEVNYGAYGIARTRAERARIEGRIAALHPGQSLHIEGDSPRQRKQEAEESRQMAVDDRQARGITEQSWKALKADRKRLQSDAKATAEKKGENPAKAKSDHALTTTPASKL